MTSEHGTYSCGRTTSSSVSGRYRRVRGSLLLEVLFAIFALVVCILPVVSLMLGSAKLNREAQIQAVAYQVARQELETVKAQSYANRVDTTKASFTIPAGLTANFSNEISMAGTYSIVNYSPYTNPPVQQITVQVMWKRMDTPYSGNTSIELSGLAAKEPGK